MYVLRLLCICVCVCVRVCMLWFKGVTGGRLCAHVQIIPPVPRAMLICSFCCSVDVRRSPRYCPPFHGCRTRLVCGNMSEYKKVRNLSCMFRKPVAPFYFQNKTQSLDVHSPFVLQLQYRHPFGHKLNSMSSCPAHHHTMMRPLHYSMHQQ